MKNLQSEVALELTKRLNNFFSLGATRSLQVTLKDDKSFVTEIDIFVSELIKEKLKHSKYTNYTFFCEEDFKAFVFPCAILDPIDGTRELVRGRPECVVSLAMMESPIISDPRNFAWLYNPFSGFTLDTEIPYVASTDKSLNKILTFVSRSEFHKGLYDKYLNNPKFDITPRGSIAFKLGLLATGACDFIISLEPKNVWDIAAGTILCEQRGIHFYENGVRVESLDRVRYVGPLVWVSDMLAPIVLKEFEAEFKDEKT